MASIVQLGVGGSVAGLPACCQDGSSAEPGAELVSDEDIGPLLTAYLSLVVMVRRVRPGQAG
jgi:hypothetical protein